jgi:methionyl-tRNA formyltransferase
MTIMKNSALKILFIGKADHFYSTIAADFIRQHFKNATVILSNRSEPFPQELKEWQGDLLISYLSQWIIPGELIANAGLASINLHPGPPEYPGIGCTNFAIYNGEEEFGITCHHMLERVDSGPIIAVRRFPVFESDSVYSITQRCYTEILYLFFQLMSDLLKGKPFPASNEIWKRKPFKRKDLDELCQLREDMSEEEIQKRIRATTFGDKVWAYRVEEKVQA